MVFSWISCAYLLVRSPVVWLSVSFSTFYCLPSTDSPPPVGVIVHTDLALPPWSHCRPLPRTICLRTQSPSIPSFPSKKCTVQQMHCQC
ncbi:hypothetical protein BKA70DRAFT_1314356 [Coprinopsis sp. MPI-PUGE-AT-0042]|nr:hypothetical protein BKA70DRAFT_1314356 [Coprinopsis sp. MPI-PUGE-AT-0042]